MEIRSGKKRTALKINVIRKVERDLRNIMQTMNNIFKTSSV